MLPTKYGAAMPTEEPIPSDCFTMSTATWRKYHELVPRALKTQALYMYSTRKTSIRAYVFHLFSTAAYLLEQPVHHSRVVTIWGGATTTKISLK